MQPCNKETEIALITKTNSIMAEKIKHIEDNVEWIKVDIANIKDFIWTVNLTMQKDNAWIKEMLNKWFSEIRLNFEKEREVAIKETKARVKEHYASKVVEKIIYTLWGAVWLSVLTAILRLIMK